MICASPMRTLCGGVQCLVNVRWRRELLDLISVAAYFNKGPWPSQGHVCTACVRDEMLYTLIYCFVPRCAYVSRGI